MGAAISKELIKKYLQKLKKHLEYRSLPEVTEQISDDLNLLNNTKLDIVITGKSGAGKSSLVNALREMTDYEEGAAKVGVTQTTTETKGYPHPTFPNVTIYDLPGIGTPQFNAEKYLQMVKLERYDFFIILASERFTENDHNLAKEIQKMGKKFYYVHTKVDQDIHNEGRKPNFNEQNCLEKILKEYCAKLADAGASDPRVFLISRWDLHLYDFPLLQEALEEDLDKLKREALIAAMPIFSKEVVKKKKAAMQSHIWKVALLSCGIGAIPVPGLHFFCDFGILVATMKYFCKVFGSDEGSLCRLAKRVGKSDDVLRSAIKKSPMAGQITREFLIKLFTKSLACGIVMAAEFALELVPVLGSLAGGATSFVATVYILQSFLHDLEEDAENVRAKAAES